jgi:hypothetical protein
MSTATTTRAASATLHRLLDEELAFSPSIQGIFSSHLPMALVALEQMGAGPDRLQAVFDAHARHPEVELRTDRDVLDVRLAEVARDGIAPTVRRRVPEVLDAPGTALFHPAIRLAYALEVGHGGQVAAALLDWEQRRVAAPPLPSRGDRRLTDVAASLASHPTGTWSRSFDLDGIARRAEILQALAGVALDDHTLDDVSAFALAAHATADDFITLHLVTGARAVRTIAGYLDDANALALAAHSLPIMAIAYVAVGAPPLLSAAELDERRAAPLPSVERIEERAVAARDPHVIKLANVALAELERTGDPLYQHLASRVVGFEV